MCMVQGGKTKNCFKTRSNQEKRGFDIPRPRRPFSSGHGKVAVGQTNLDASDGQVVVLPLPFLNRIVEWMKRSHMCDVIYRFVDVRQCFCF